MIQAGELAPGTRLRQVDVANRFRVSTTPVREAFATLAREGLVRQDSHRGVVVFVPSVAELAELYEIRGVLEPLATELAGNRLTDAVVARLTDIVAGMRDADPERYSELNRDFHATIYAAAGRPRLADIIEGLRDASAAYLRMTVAQFDDAYTRQVHAEHEAILAALVARRGAEAGQLMAKHLQHNSAHVAELIDLRSVYDA